MLVVVAIGIGLIAVPWLASSALAGVSASVAEANRVVGFAAAVLLVIAAVTVGGCVLLARRRQLREEPAAAEFSARVQAALDARDGGRPRRLAPPEPLAPLAPGTPIQRVAAYRLDRGPTATPRSFNGGHGS